MATLHRRRAALLACCALAAPAALAQTPTLESLGIARPHDISGDGTIVTGEDGSGAFRWTSAAGLFALGGGGLVTISDDGSTISGNDIDAGTGLVMAALWLGGFNWQTLGGIPGGVPSGQSLSSNYGVSGDGKVVVGLGWVTAGDAHAFRWEQGTGMVDLGSTVAGASSRANGIAATDTTVVIGWQENAGGFRQGARWDSGVQSLYTFNGSAVGEAQAVTPDGSVVVGQGVNREAWRWTAPTGVQPIGQLPGFNFSTYALAVSDDGSVVVGFAGFGFDRDAFIWFDGLGLFKLDDYLTALGLDLTGWDLGTATGISADGRVICGFGSGPVGPIEGWVVTLPDFTPTSYCTAGTTFDGCNATMGSSGTPSLSNAGGFTLTCSNVPGNKNGIFFYGISGRNSASWGNSASVLCVKAPTQRMNPPASSGGTSGQCDGAYAGDWNAYVAAGPGKPIHQALVIGSTVDAQAWFRDPQAGTGPVGAKGTALSDGLEFIVLP